MNDRLLEETLYHVANGYIGVRGCFEEGHKGESIRGCYINGFYDTVPLNYPEKLYGFPDEAQRLVNLPDVQTIRLFMDGEEFSLFSGEVLGHKRKLDTQKGVTYRDILWKNEKGTFEIKITRMASFVHPELFLIVYSVKSVDFSGEIELACNINCDVSNFTDENDPRVASEKIKHIFMDTNKIVGDVSIVECKTAVSKLGLSICRQFVAGGDIAHFATKNGCETRIKSKILPNQSLTTEVYTILSDTRRRNNPTQHALEKLNECFNLGAENLLQGQADFLADFWMCARVDIGGCDELNDGMEFNLYQLLQSAGRDGISNVASKGVSGEGYEGHYFWDTEIYIFPFFLFTQPETAKQLLRFRLNTLDGARNHAIVMGHKKGALYPWRTISGSECSSFFPAGSAQYHLTGDVAHAFIQYYYATDDLDFMQYGLEVLLETARLWLDTANLGSDRKYHIHSVTGPDEYTCCVSDNYYTNRTAQHNLLGAVEVYARLKKAGLHSFASDKINFDESELLEFARVGNAMFLPYDEKLGIHAQDSSFLTKPVWNLDDTPKEKFPLLLHYHPLYLYRFQVCKQADTVLSHFLFEDGVSEDVLRKSYLYYDKITTHDSSLSVCVFGIMASRLGFYEKAYSYFSETVRGDLDNTHGNTKDGLHVANLGGSWLAVACGFAGLRLRKNGLHFRFSLPKQWEEYSFRVRYHGSLLKVSVGKESKVELLSGGSVTVFIDGVETKIK
ncbi:MAG: family 65 glycosyl hydrolase [Defluviitaleaceae bacterium]|nr:family 65 glycosyl hydrolase [Defluviitaleaceae bacterium]